MKVKVILNPYADRWRARSAESVIETAFRTAGLNFEITLIPEPGHGRHLAVAAVDQGYDVIVAAGGDGTVNEVVNGLIAAAGREVTMPLAVIPVGTGNDFSDMAGLPRDLAAIVEIIGAGKTRQVDVGRVIYDGAEHYFDNNCALAMEPMVTIENVHMTRLKGNIRYLVALVKALIKLQAWQMHIDWDGGGFDGPTILLSVCNSRRTGGLFPMAPEARMDDGLFDFVHAPELPKLMVLSLLVRLLRGTHVQHQKVTYGRTTRLEITSQPATPIHADGEVISEGAHEISYDILPGKLTLLAPAKPAG